MKTRYIPYYLFTLICVGIFYLLLCWLTASNTGEDLAASREFELTVEEKEWIKAHPVIKVGAPIYPPHYMHDSQNKLGGCSVEYLAKIQESLGVTFEHIEFSNLSSAIEALKKQEVDIMTAFEPNEQRRKILAFTEPYLCTPRYFVATSEKEWTSRIKDLEGKSIAVVEGHILNKLISQEFPELKVVTYSTVSECILALCSHKVDLFCDDAPILYGLIGAFGISNFKMLSLAPKSLNAYSSIAVRKDWPTFVNLLNKKIAHLGPQASQEIINSYSPQNLQSQNIQLTYTLSISLIIVCVIVVVILTLYMTQVKERLTTSSQLQDMRMNVMLSIGGQMRHPLSTMISIMTEMKKNGVAQSDSSQVTLIKENSQKLMHLMDEIMDFSKLEAGKLKVLKAPHEVRHVIYSSFQRNLKSCHANVVMNMNIMTDPIIPQTLVFDDRRLEQVLDILLQDSVKNTSEGTINLNAQWYEDLSKLEQEVGKDLSGCRQAAGYLKFIVQDTGESMGRSFSESPFQFYNTLRDTNDGLKRGAGVSLPLSHSLVILMGGELWYTESEGIHKFVLILPLDLPKRSHFHKKEKAEIVVHQSRDVQRSQSSFDAKGILVVDDCPINLKLALHFLNQKGEEIHTASNGLEGLNRLKQQQYKVTLMDIDMPEMDGVTAIKEYRAYENEQNSYKADGEKQLVIALTGNTNEGDKYVTVGFDACLLKPFNIKDFDELMETRSIDLG